MMYLSGSELPSHLSRPSPIPDTPHQKERHQQGKGNALLMPRPRKEGWDTNPIRSRERLDGLLKYYHREAARVG